MFVRPFRARSLSLSLSACVRTSAVCVPPPLRRAWQTVWPPPAPTATAAAARCAQCSPRSASARQVNELRARRRLGPKCFARAGSKAETRRRPFSLALQVPSSPPRRRLRSSFSQPRNQALNPPSKSLRLHCCQHRHCLLHRRLCLLASRGTVQTHRCCAPAASLRRRSARQRPRHLPLLQPPFCRPLCFLRPSTRTLRS
jgi:hypothetical protein